MCLTQSGATPEENLEACNYAIDHKDGLSALVSDPASVPRLTAQLYYRRANHYYSNENWEDAHDDLNETITRIPADVQPVAEGMDEREKASVEIYADAYFMRGWVNHYLQQPSAAKQDYKKAAELNPLNENFQKFAKEYGR
jgi:tetratricopeptide (TPR) repeat protein